MHSAIATIRDQKFTEPVALSSTASADLPLPGTAFVPIAIVSLWIILAAEPGSGWFHRHVLSWSGSLHIRGLVDDLKEYIPVFAFGIGLVFGFSFDTTGPRRDVVEPATTSRRRGLFGRRRTTDADGDGVPDADEPVSRDRAADDGEVPVEERDRVTTR
jgi:hypothetical protein